MSVATEERWSLGAEHSERLIKPDYKAAEQAATSLLNQAGLYKPPVNPLEIATLLDVQVRFVRFSGESEGVSGLFDFRENKILVNSDDPGNRQTFTIAHELGHKVLHTPWAASDQYKVLWRDLRNQSNDRREKEANVFAACLLMPREMMRSYRGMSAGQLSKLFAVSEEFASNRLRNLSRGF